MRNTLFLLPLLVVAISSTAHADTVDVFTVNNTITFSVPVPPPGGAFSVDDFKDPSVLADINGHNAEGSLDLFSSTAGGGFDLTYLFPGGQEQIAASGAQLFFGTTADPTILTGTYNLNDRTGGTDTLVIAQQPPSNSMPEPPTLLLLATGSLGLFGAARRMANP